MIRRGRIRRPRRVGVLGPFHAGKTVLLTSLISQIRYRSAGGHELFGPGVNLAEIESSSDTADTLPTLTGLPAFDYNTAQDRLAHGGWPPKTVSASEYRSLIVRSDDRWRMYDLSLIDWPGERLADLAMVGHGSFDRWSDAMMHSLDLEVFRSLARDYLQCMQPGTIVEDNSTGGQSADSIATEQELAMAWRRLLASFVDHALPFITPSSFLVDIENRYATETLGTSQPVWSVDELSRLAIGIAPGEPLFPLSAHWRAKAPEMTARIAARFEDYVAKVVRPVADALAVCDHLVLLVDVAHLLEAGPRGVEGTTRLFEELLGWINPGTTSAVKAIDWISWMVAGDRFRLGGVRQISVIGTQADRIHAEDRQAAEGLLHQLVEPLVRKYQVQKRLKMKYGIVAAVNSTRSETIGPDGKRLLTFGHEGNSYEAPASAIPATWPVAWKPGQFAFPRPQPRLPVKRTQAPDEFGLGQLLQWILH